MMSMLAVAVLSAFQTEGGKFGRWIEDLGLDDPAVRAEASLHLTAAGRGAWPALESAASRHPDLETRSRCKDLLDRARLRRRLPWRVLDEAPDAVAILRSGSSAERIALLRLLSRAYDESSDLILDMVQDPDPEVVVAASEALQERRNTDWAPRLLELYAREDCPRASRAYELLAMASSRIGPEELRDRFADAGPRGRVRLVQLALNASLPLALPTSVVRDWLDRGDSPTRRLALSWLRERGCPAALPYLEPLLSLPDPAVVAEALSTLRSCSWRPQPQNLHALLAHEEPPPRGPGRSPELPGATGPPSAAPRPRRLGRNARAGGGGRESQPRRTAPRTRLVPPRHGGRRRVHRPAAAQLSAVTEVFGGGI